MEEKLIIQGCQKNDRKCQRAFVDTYSPYLFGVCRRYISDYDLAKDCLQESLVHILNNIGKYEATGSFKSWAARVTATQCLQWIRREKKHINFDIEDAIEPSEAEKVSDHLEVQDVMNFLGTLSERYRIAINMFIIEGYSHKEISKQLEITESSSRSLVARARKIIIEEFAKRNSQNSDNSKTMTSLTTLKKIQKLA